MTSDIKQLYLCADRSTECLRHGCADTIVISVDPDQVVSLPKLIDVFNEAEIIRIQLDILELTQGL